MGLIDSFGNVGGYVGPYVVGFLKARTGSFHAPHVCLAVSLLCSGLLMLTLGRKQK